MKIFIDTNVFLDAILNRDNGLSKNVIKHLELLNTEISLSDISVINIAYIVRKEFTKDEIKNIINLLIKRYNIISANSEIILNANSSNFKDFEDGVQYFCAREIEADLIITRNKKDFKTSNITVLSAEEFYTLYME